MREETSMLAGVLQIRFKCGCHPPNAGDLTGLLGLGFGIGLLLELGSGGNFPQGQLS